MFSVILGWILWGIITLFAALLTWGCRSYAKSEEGFKCNFQWTNVVQTLFFLIIAILFLIFKWNKLHILWIAPLIFLSSHLFVSYNIPILSPIVIYVTKVYLSIVLLGIDLKGGFDELLYDGSFKRGQLGLARRFEIIRTLAEKRIQFDSTLSNEEKSNTIANLISNNTLLINLPEAKIVNIVASYLEYKLLGLSDKKILTTIERTRHFFGKKGIMPLELTLANYIKYRIELECSYEQAKSIRDDFIEDAIKETSNFFLIEKNTELS